MTKGNYRVVVSYDVERNVFGARVPELGQCHAEGATRSEAIAKAEEEIAAQLANIAERGGRAPTPVDEDDEVGTGSLSLKVSKSLHKELLWLAKQEGIGVDQLGGELLAQIVEAKRGGRAGSHQGHGQGHGAGHLQGNARPGGRPQPQGGNGPSGNHYEGNSHQEQRIDSRPRGSNYGARYMGILEDRANFIEYVRGLGQGGGGQQGSGGGNGAYRNDGRGGRNRRRGRGGRPGGQAPGQPGNPGAEARGNNGPHQGQPSQQPNQQAAQATGSPADGNTRAGGDGSNSEP